jgi:hypothetical protein
MTTDTVEIGSRRPPTRRTAAEVVALISPVAKPPIESLLAGIPRGNGHAVLVLPALLRSDAYTAYMRQFLTTIGYATHGWNLGVNIGPTRRLLHRAAVRQVITVCSPIHQPARNFWLPLDPLLGLWPGVDLPKLAEEIAQPLPVPGTFLFSRDDGLVNCAACRDAHAVPEDNIEIGGPHVLIAQNPQVLTIVAHRLARHIAAPG